MRDAQPIYSVSQLCRETRLLLEGTFLTLQIEGEISSISRPTSGHIYFTLKDDKAQVQCTMFRSQVRKIGFKPENGLQILLKARVSLYEARGNFQLIGEQMKTAGEGALRQQFDALKQRLSIEGLFDTDIKKNLPVLPLKAGIITSPSGAAVHDVITVLNNRFPSLPILIYPVTVQGEKARHEIVAAIELANKRNDCDVLILARGGGSLEDLWAFNEEVVARAIHQSALPIVSAIGHEVDFTIADFVADHRAPTPSAAAELISPDQHQWINHFNYLAKQLSDQINNDLLEKKQHFKQLQHRLNQTHPGSQLHMHVQQLDDCQTRLLQAPKYYIQKHQLRLADLNSSLVSYNPNQRIQYLQKRLTLLQQRLSLPLQHQLQNARLRFTTCNKGLETLSPLATLSRGYAIAKDASNNRIINNVKQLQLGDKVTVQLTDGTLKTHVEEINDNT